MRGFLKLLLGCLAALLIAVAFLHRDRTVHAFSIPSILRDKAMTADEALIKQDMELMLTSSAATHRLVYDGSKVMTGRLEEENSGSIIFFQQFGQNGSLRVQLPRSRVVRIENLQEAPPEISLRDIRFHMEFPDKQFYKKPPYTLVTDESFFAVEYIVDELRVLYTQITQEFAPLIVSSERVADIQLLIFSNSKEYEDFRTRDAPRLKGCSGFYSHRAKRMTVYHQRDADWVKDGNRQIDAIEKEYMGKVKSTREWEQLRQWKSSAQGELLGQASKATQRVIRHEGSHQLFFELGIQNSLQMRRGWVTEGLATYCETAHVGWFNESRMEELKPALMNGGLIPFRTILAAPYYDNSLAYAEAWALIHMLMQPEYRSDFFTYLDWLRKHPYGLTSDPVQEICQFLSLSSEELEELWKAYMDKLVRR